MTDALHVDDARFRLAMDSAGIGMAIVSLDGHLLDVNPALCRMLGYAAEALQGRSVPSLTHPDDLVLSAALFETLLGDAADAQQVEKRYLRSDGSSIEVQLNCALMRDAEGTPQYFIAQLNDVTAKRQAERALHALNASLEQRVQERTLALEVSNQRLQTFAYGVSHDLRAPLRTIDGFASQLERQAGAGLDAQAQDSLHRIRAASLRMGELIDSLLELARIARAELRPMTVDISLLAEWAAAELQDAQPQRAARITVQPGMQVVGDERLLKIVFTQLLRNAWQFSAARPQVEVEIQGQRETDGLRLTVRDQGIGFDMTYAGKLFEPFQRLHGSEEGAGHGIGLAIAQQAVERHGGKIWADAVLGQGAAFHVTLPDLQPKEPTAA